MVADAFIPIYPNTLPTVPKPSKASRTASLVVNNLEASQSAITRLLNHLPSAWGFWAMAIKKGNGLKFTVLSLATQCAWKNADDEWSSKTEWHRIAIFRPRLAEYVATAIKKGSQVLVEGSLVSSIYERPNGKSKSPRRPRSPRGRSAPTWSAGSIAENPSSKPLSPRRTAAVPPSRLSRLSIPPWLSGIAGGPFFLCAEPAQKSS